MSPFLLEMKVKKYLDYNMRTDGLGLLDVNQMFYELFQRKDYEWWGEVKQDDVVVDLGACVGFFTCHALDRGAKKIYSVEANRDHLRTLCYNVSDHWIDHQTSPVVPIHAAIGKDDRYSLNYFGENVQAPRMSFKELIDKYQIPWIDYLKIDIEGAEYDIFQPENLQYLKHHVGHIACEFHLDAFRESPYEWIQFRDNMCQEFDLSKIHFLRHEDHNLAHDDEKILSEWPIGWGGSFMLYITN